MASRDIMRHRTVGWESRAAGRHSGVAGDAVVQPEDAAERWKARLWCGRNVQRYSGRRSGAADAKGDAEQTGRDIAECRRMAVEVPAARGCCEKACGRRDHGGRQCGRQVWRRKTRLGAEDTSEGGGRIWRRKTHQKPEDASEAGRHIGSRKTRQKQKQSPRRKGVA